MNRFMDLTRTKKVLIQGMMIAMIGLLAPSWVVANEHMIIAASPSLAALLNALAHAFEDKHPGVKVQLFYGTGLELRQAIATMENRNRSQYFIGSGPMHLIAPGGDEVITRLEARQYAQARTPYATESLVLVVPESLVEAPASFEALAQDVHIRIAVADPKLTVLGQKTQEFLQVLGGPEAWKGRVDVATDVRGVLDHLMNGKADAAIIFGPDAIQAANRVRVTAIASGRPVMHSMAMERFCPNRPLCEEFLGFIRSPDAHSIIKQLGYDVPTK